MATRILEADPVAITLARAQRDVEPWLKGHLIHDAPTVIEGVY